MPTANIISAKGYQDLIEAKVYSKGIVMWLLSQGEYVKVIGPKEIVDEMKHRIAKMSELYESCL